MNEELKACPWCGKAATIKYVPRVFYIHCGNDCCYQFKSAMVDFADNLSDFDEKYQAVRKDAIDAWNTRE